MTITAEQKITKLLSSNEILHVDNACNAENRWIDTTNSHLCNKYNLSEFLKNYKPEPSPYEGQYFFIR